MSEDVAREEEWPWLRDGSIKRETKSLIKAAQEQAIRTNAIKAKLDKTQAEVSVDCVGKWMRL